MSDIEFEINGKKLTAKPNQMLIQVADAAGIYIPRFCYHNQLSIAANCRMCLVEVEKAPKPLPACATPITPGMKVFTRSQKALEAQKAVMEFLLINHPLDCPICDQGGECELQDLSMGYGRGQSNYKEGKRAVKDEDLGPLIATEMTRCIQCTRCVRFGEEVAGFRELGATGRGEDMEITTYIEHALRSVVSGNIIDLCPVGALTSKPYRFTARAWELDQFPAIAPHDCLGSNVFVHTRYGKVMRVVPRENENLNQVWLSDRDRFSYQGLYHSDRLVKPRIRLNDHWQETNWPSALEYAIAGLKNILANSMPDQLAALAAPSSTLEEFYLLQKLFRSLGSSNVDHRLRQVDFRDQDQAALFPNLGCSLSELENKEVIILIGSNIQKEQPVLSLRVRKAALRGAKILSLNVFDYSFHFPQAEKVIVSPQDFVKQLKQLEKSFGDYVNGKKVAILLGAVALNHPQAAEIRNYCRAWAEKKNAALGYLTEGANAAGAWIAGAIPHRGAAGEKISRSGADVQGIWGDEYKGYVLLNVEPEFDCANAPQAMDALKKADFVLALSTFRNPVLEKYADVILPIAPFTETSGTFVNALGEWQSFKEIAKPFAESRPAWKVLRVLANLLKVEGFDYTSSEQVHHEIKEKMEKDSGKFSNVGAKSFEVKPVVADELVRIGEVPLYATDNIVRRAKALQHTQTIIEGKLTAARFHSETARKLNIHAEEKILVKQKSGEAQLTVLIDNRVPEGAVYIPAGIPETSGLGELFGAVEIDRPLF